MKKFWMILALAGMFATTAVSCGEKKEEATEEAPAEGEATEEAPAEEATEEAPAEEAPAEGDTATAE
ncbi:MAG TPA: hypothetical protein VK177_01425 [Flavobacteriales bacterium]|nr:hypothetical protein [Flavobacteriales bacterium]